MVKSQTALVHLASGIGNIVLSTPLLVALGELGYTTDVILDPDYPQTVDLLRDWSLLRAVSVRGASTPSSSYDVVIPALPPFYWPRIAPIYRNRTNTVPRPPDNVFYENEQEFYLFFSRRLGYPAARRPIYRLPVAPSARFGTTAATLVLAPGCKTGEMASKRWPHFPLLAERFRDVVVVGTPDDGESFAGKCWGFPSQVRSFLGKLSLRETAELMASAGVIVANDSGLGHLAGALGIPTVMVFGPTPFQTLGPFPPNVYIVRKEIACSPCWFGNRLAACQSRVDCLEALSVDIVEGVVRECLGQISSDHSLIPGAPSPRHPSGTSKSATVAIQGTTQVVTGAPLVSCITPTAGRSNLVKQAIQYFRRQDYPNKELLILDDGPEFSAEDVPRDPRIRYLRIEGTRSLGSKRNLACELASGEIIAHWDDDDWSAPNRLSSQVRALLETASIGLCGLRRIYFFEPHRLRAWLYEHPAGGRPWVAGGTMCYRKEFWQQLRFPDVTEGEDTRFVWSDRGSRVLQLDDPSIYAATVHSLNTSPKRTSDSRWRSWPIDAIRELLSEDWQFYKDWTERGTEAAVRGAGASVS